MCFRPRSRPLPGEASAGEGSRAAARSSSLSLRCAPAAAGKSPLVSGVAARRILFVGHPSRDRSRNPPESFCLDVGGLSCPVRDRPKHSGGRGMGYGERGRMRGPGSRPWSEGWGAVSRGGGARQERPGLSSCPPPPWISQLRPS